MQNENRFTLKAEYRARLIDAATQAIEREEVTHNLVTDVGLTHILNRWTNASAVSFLGYVAVGTGSGTPAASDTALITELTRKALTWSVTSAVATGSVLFNTSEANGTLTEVGLIDASSGSTIKTHANFTTPIVKNSTKLLQLDITITVARA